MNELDKIARERAMDKVRKLLALAGDKCNEHEAANAASQAEKLMRHYQIDAGEVTLKDIETDEAFEQNVSDVSFEGIPGYQSKQAPSWVGFIAIGCGVLFTCKVDLVNIAGQGLKVRFSGYAMDVLLCKWVYELLCRTVYRLSKEQMSGAGMSAAKSFRMGAGSQLQKRLIELKKERDQANTADSAAKELGRDGASGMGLVIYDRKQERVEEMFGATKTKQKKTSVGDREAHQAGKDAAMKINIPNNRPIDSRARHVAIGQ